MNHIKKIQVVTAAYTEQVLDAQETLENFRAYLQSSKFHTDTTVQVKDVLNRLEPIRDGHFLLFNHLLLFLMVFFG